METWSFNFGEWSWRKSLLVKSAMLGIGMATMLWVGWPQPQEPDHDRVPLLSLLSQSTAKDLSSTSAMEGVSSIEDFQYSALKTEETSSQPAGQTLLVDLNTVSRMELERLPGIGVKLANRILSYRSLYGPFQEVSDLVKISGIGEKRLQRLEPFVTVETEVGERTS